MTNRDPNTGDFIRKFNDYYQCVHHYLSFKNTETLLLSDLEKQDINLVCYYELHEMRKHVRANPWALSKYDFEFLHPSKEHSIRDKLNGAYGHL
jgi:hypothetical protein